MVPAEVVANAKLAILDCLGVAVLAVSHELGQIILRLAQKEQWQGPCTIWGSAACAGARDAAFANASLAHALDYDDGGHVTTYILAASLTLGERAEIAGRTLLEAFIAGREVRMSLDPIFSRRFEGMGPGARGWHANGILGPLAAACSAAKVLGLDLDQTVNAIGLAAGSCGALGRDGGTMAKPFRAGHAAATGVLCALLAGEGCTADGEALEGNYGLLSALGPLDENILASLAQNLGREYHSTRAKIKKYPAANATHAPVEAMIRLVTKRPASPADVERIDCDLKPYPLLRLAPKKGNEGRFSMAYCLAVALTRRRLTPDDFTDEAARNAEVRKLIQCVRHNADSQSVAVVLKNGEIITEPLLPVHDLREWSEVADKFNRCTSTILSTSQRAAVLDQVAHLEQIPAVTSLATSLRIRSS